MKANLKVRCSMDSLGVIRDFVRNQLHHLEIDQKVSSQIVLATDEACANCIIHQHQCNPHSSIEVTLYREADMVYIEIKDRGQAFPIHTYRPTRLEEIIRKRKKGGLGIHIIQKLMDEVKVEEGSGFFVYKLGKYVSNGLNS